MDALSDEEAILNANENKEHFFTNMNDECIGKDIKINLQDAVTQKYWLGRLAYELAIRSDDVKAIKARCDKLSNTIDLYKGEEYSPKERCLILSLDKYGFTSQPENNLLKTEHTSYPLHLQDTDGNKMEINTRRHISKLLGILDGRPKTYYSLNNDSYKKIKKLGLLYSSGNNYLSLIYL